MTQPTPEDLVSEIQARARLLVEAIGSPGELAEIDFEQFCVGSYFGIAAAMLVLRERNLLQATS